MNGSTLQMTSEGRTVAALAILCLGLGAWQASMVLCAIGCVGASLLSFCAWWTWQNLREVQVIRRPPSEFFARRRAHGSWTLRIPQGRQQGAHEVWVREPCSSKACGVEVLPGVDCNLQGTWVLPDRGAHNLDSVMIWSRWPLGFWHASRTEEMRLEVMVYPEPRPAELAIESGLQGKIGGEGRLAGSHGDVRGLRPYAPRDRPGAIHWPSSARARALLVTDRSDASGVVVTVDVPSAADAQGDYEQRLGEACFQVLEAFRRGYRVGLKSGHGLTPARAGARWRRNLLEQLGGAARESVG